MLITTIKTKCTTINPKEYFVPTSILKILVLISVLLLGVLNSYLTKNGRDLNTDNILIIIFEIFGILFIWFRLSKRDLYDVYSGDCEVIFKNGEIEWEFDPMIYKPMQRLGQVKITYHLNKEDIIDSWFNEDTNELEIECNPIGKFIAGTINKTVDYRYKNSRVLISSENSSDPSVLDLYKRYIGATPETKSK